MDWIRVAIKTHDVIGKHEIGIILDDRGRHLVSVKASGLYPLTYSVIAQVRWRSDIAFKTKYCSSFIKLTPIINGN